MGTLEERQQSIQQHLHLPHGAVTRVHLDGAIPGLGLFSPLITARPQIQYVVLHLSQHGGTPATRKQIRLLRVQIDDHVQEIPAEPAQAGQQVVARFQVQIRLGLLGRDPGDAPFRHDVRPVFPAGVQAVEADIHHL